MTFKRESSPHAIGQHLSDAINIQYKKNVLKKRNKQHM